MTWPVDFDLGRINLSTARVHGDDGARQIATVREILSRFQDRPGVVLADEVGMGKTFVALGVAVAAALGDKGGRPVVVMVPASLRDKWPRDWDVFKSLCLTEGRDQKLRAASAHSALDFFRLLDDPASRRSRIIFLSHGAFDASLNDPWVKLAILKRALHGIHLGERRSSLPRFAADLIRTKSTFSHPDLFDRLLQRESKEWMTIINEYARREQDRLTDDPIPEAVERVLERGDLDLDEIREELRNLPARTSANIDDRLITLRGRLNTAVKNIWPQTLTQARFRSPLLILDEAHHLKNPATRLASLFVDSQIPQVCRYQMRLRCRSCWLRDARRWLPARRRPRAPRRSALPSRRAWPRATRLSWKHGGRSPTARMGRQSRSRSWTRSKLRRASRTSA